MIAEPSDRAWGKPDYWSGQPTQKVWTDVEASKLPKPGDLVKLDFQPIVEVLGARDLGVRISLIVREATGERNWPTEWLIPKTATQSHPQPAPNKPIAEPHAKSDRDRGQPTAPNKRLKAKPEKSDREPTPQGDRVQVTWNFQMTGGETKDLETNRRARFVVVDAADRWLIANIHQALDPHIVSNLEREPVKVGSETTLPHTAAVLAAIPEKSNSSNKVKPVGTASWPTLPSKPAPQPQIAIAPVTQKKTSAKKPAVQTGEERMPIAAKTAKQPAVAIEELIARASTVTVTYGELPCQFFLQREGGKQYIGTVLPDGRVSDNTPAYEQKNNKNNRYNLALRLALRGVAGFEIQGKPPAGCDGTLQSLHFARALFWKKIYQGKKRISPLEWQAIAIEFGLCPKPQPESQPQPEQDEKYPGLEVWADSNCWQVDIDGSRIGSFWRGGSGQWVAQPYLGRPIYRRFDSEQEAIDALINAWEFAQEERAKEPHIGPATCTMSEWEAARAKVPPGFAYLGNNRWRDGDRGFTNLPHFARTMTLRELAIVTGRVTVR